MSMKHKLCGIRTTIVLPLIIGVFLGGITLNIEMISSISENLLIGAVQCILMILLFPGLLGAMAVSGNIHAFHLWVAAGLNVIFYFLLVWVFMTIIMSKKVTRMGTQLKD